MPTAGVDAVLMRITDIFFAFPRLNLALAFVAALGPGIENAVIATAITSWPPYARIARAETLSIRQADCIDAVKLLGAGPARIVLRHVMPMCVPSVIVRVTLDMAIWPASSSPPPASVSSAWARSRPCPSGAR